MPVRVNFSRLKTENTERPYFANKLIAMRTLLFLVLMLFTNAGMAQTETSINNLQFITGQWRVQHQWGNMEETWSAPMGNNMMGSYRCVKDGKIVFYEFMAIEQTDSVPVLYLRHFGPQNIAWEDKNAPGKYPLVALEKNKAQFKKEDGSTTLTFIRQSPTQLQVVLDSKTKEGTPEHVEFNYRLKGNGDVFR